ncbi:expressed unknown protein [Seminavis robusta]|uniref:Uncharacterized protein n=1 Tax=Seminavis robusta TaxID=568900 RepID=A0A9N8DCN4_9STRA|nr:expressed unknown protein [Seminavis robusta]|eukprot:Sro31_g020080.1 n/a (330) ;mRNA; r:24552-25541
MAAMGIDNTTLVIHKPDNGLRETPNLSTATHVTIWGGCLANCGESAAAALVRSRREHLKKFIYLPERHKGGRMVRPYYSNDRGATMEFPSLEVLGYYKDLGTPLDVKWIVPNLKTLVVFDGGRTGRAGRYGHQWTTEASTPMPEWYERHHIDDVLQRTRVQCPKLEQILVCAQPDYDSPEKMGVVRKLTPPFPAPWECLRLLEVAARTPQGGQCHICRLPTAVVDLVVSFFHSPKWKEEDFVVNPVNHMVSSRAERVSRGEDGRGRGRGGLGGRGGRGRDGATRDHVSSGDNSGHARGGRGGGRATLVAKIREMEYRRNNQKQAAAKQS